MNISREACFILSELVLETIKAMETENVKTPLTSKMLGIYRIILSDLRQDHVDSKHSY